MVLVLAIPELILLITALAGLLMTWALRDQIGRFLLWALEGIPVVGAAAAAAVASALGRFADWTNSWAIGALQPIIDAIDLIAGVPTALFNGLVSAVAWFLATAHGLQAGLSLGLAQVGSRIAAIVAQAQLLAAQVATILSRLAAQAASIASIVSTVVPAAVARAVATAEAWAAAKISAATSLAQAVVLALESRVLAMLGQEAASRAAGDAAARAFAAARAAEVLAAATAAVAAERVFTGQAIDGIGQAIGGIEAKIGDAALPLTITATIATTIAEVERIARCSDPMCEYLSPQLDALQAIQGVATLALLAELLSAAVRNPEEAARDTLAMAQPFIDGARSLFDGVTGAQV